MLTRHRHRKSDKGSGTAAASPFRTRIGTTRDRSCISVKNHPSVSAPEEGGVMLASLRRRLRSTVSGAEQKETRCTCCGNCCTAFGGHLNASRGDLERWRREGREDLLSRVNRLGWIWMAPQTGQPEGTCPFLGRSGTEAFCRIHDTKPAMCRDYPTLAHGHRCLRGGFLKS